MLTDGSPDVGVSTWHNVAGAASIDRKPLGKPRFNRAPTANPGPSRYAELGSEIVLDASRSWDPDGDTLTYVWSVKSNQGNASAQPRSTTAELTQFKPDRVGNYLVRLRVADAHGATDEREMELVVKAPDEAIPSPYAGPRQVVTVGTEVLFDGSQSYNPTGASLRLAWRLRSKPNGSVARLSSAIGQSTALKPDQVGIYLVDLRVSAGSLESLPDTVEILAEPAKRMSAKPDAPAEVIVTDQVLRRDIEPIGMNLTKIAGGTNFATNNFFSGTGFEPMLYRRLLRLDRAGSDAKGQWLEWDSDEGPHLWKTLSTGFGNGATVRFYRLVDAKGEPLEFKQGIGDASGANHLVLLGEAKIPDKAAKLPQGGWMPNGENRVYLDHSLNLKRGDYAFLVLERQEVPIEQMHERVRQYYRGNFQTLWTDNGITASLVPHPAPLPEDFAMRGKTCLRLDVAATGPARVGQWIFYPFDQKEGQWYSQLHPGRTYRFSVWLRRNGSGSGEVRAGFGGNPAYAVLNQQKPWLVTDKWQHFTYDLVAGPYPVAGSHSGPGLEFGGPGTYFVDNLMLSQFDLKHDFDPLGPQHLSLDAWLASSPEFGPKPAVRFYPLSHQTSSVDNLLGNHDGNPTYSVNDGAFRAASGVTVPAMMAWAYKTGTSPGNRVVPFLTFTEQYTEADWSAIVEYLGVPFENGVDTAQSKPFAYLRSRQRMHGRPWIDDFREIVIEYGNETWHNGAGGFGWYGFGAPGAVHQGGTEYGLFARYMFQEYVTKLPAWSKYHLGDKLRFALGANYSVRVDGAASYGEAAVMNNRVTDYLGHANYVGPKWETNDKGKSTFDAHGLQATLLGLEGVRALVSDSAEGQRKINGTRGQHYQLEAYEGGPSGYWTNKGEAAEIDELYGKSLAMGVAALDAWMFSSQNGYAHQCYHGFASGLWWSSHTMPEAGGFRAHPGWLALTLRNRFARGTELLAVNFVSQPSVEVKGDKGTERVPLVSAYAIKDSSSISVFVLSRKYPGQHDGVNLGNGYTPVVVHLPLAGRPRRITLHKLAHIDGSPANPSENNRQAEKVAIHSSEISLSAYGNPFRINSETGGGADGMPPGTVFLYLFEL